MKNSEKYFRNGKYKLELIPQSRRMSHWVYSPVLTRESCGEVVLDLSGSDWDLRQAAETDDGIMITLARYPDGIKTYEVKLLPDKSTFLFEGKEYPTSSVKSVLDEVR